MAPPMGIGRSVGSVGPAKLPEHGFAEMSIPEMPSYIQSYSKRGNGFDGETTPVYSQQRWGNPRYKGGMGAFVSELGDNTFFESLKQKRGNAGVFEIERWTPGGDWRGNYGVASLDALKNYREYTRGGSARAGAPKRGDYIERTGYWDQTARPGIAHGRFTQMNDNYGGLYEFKRQTPIVERESDMLQLRDMIEHNPLHIPSHSAKQAKAIYDKEFPEKEANQPMAKAYQDNLQPGEVRTRGVGLTDQNPYVIKPGWLGY